MDSTAEDYYTLEAMRKYGGSFVKTLAELCWHSDLINYRKIKATWPEYFEEYRKKAGKK